MNNSSARRNGGRGAASSNTKSVTDLAMAAQAKEQVNRTFIRSCIEKSVAKVQELRVAGMINNNGADDIRHELIMALVVMDDPKQASELVHT